MNWQLHGPLAGFVVEVLSLAVSLLIVVLVIRRDFTRPIHRVLAGIAFVSLYYNAFQILFSFDPAVVWVKFGYAGAICLIPLLADFPDALLHSMHAGFRVRAVSWGFTGFFLATLPTDLMFLGKLDESGTSPLALGGPLMVPYAGLMAFLLLRVAWRLGRAMRAGVEEMMKRRIEFILLGELFYGICALHDILLRQQVWRVFDFTIVEWATLAFMIIVAYSSLRYRLIDIDIVLSHGIVYSLLTLSTAATYWAGENLLQNWVEPYLPINVWWFKLVPAFFVAILFGTMQYLFRRLTDALFLPGALKKLSVFQFPNFQYLFLDGRVAALKKIQGEIDTLVKEIECREKKSPSEKP